MQRLLLKHKHLILVIDCTEEDIESSWGRLGMRFPKELYDLMRTIHIRKGTSNLLLSAPKTRGHSFRSRCAYILFSLIFLEEKKYHLKGMSD